MRGTTSTPWARPAPAPGDCASITVTVSVPWQAPPCPPVACCDPWGVVLHIGAPRETDRRNRTPGAPGVPPTERKQDLTMDLQADKEFTATLKGKDEVGNVTDLPAGTTVVYDVDNDAVITLTDNGDGTAVVAATGVLGVATLTATATREDGSTASGVLAIQVVVGEAETFEIVASDVREVTPDEDAPAEPVEPTA